MSLRLFSVCLATVALIGPASSLSAQADVAPDSSADASPEVVELDPFEVSGSPVLRELRLSTGGDKTSVLGSEQIAAMNAQDIADALRRVPGVSVSRYNPVGSFGGSDGGAVFIRGHGSGRPGSEIAIFFDGIARFTGVWTHPLLDSLAVDAADSIEVFKSAQPVELGNMAFGGLNIVPKQAREEGLHGAGTLTFGSYDTWMARAEGGYGSDTENIYAMASHRESNGHRPNADGATDAIYLRGSREIGEHWSASLLYTYNEGWAHDPDRVDETPPPPVAGVLERFETISHFGIAKLSHRHGTLSGDLKFYLEDGQMDWRQRHLPPPPPFPPQQLNTITDFQNYGVHWREHWAATENLSVSGGIDYDIYGGSVSEIFALGPVNRFDEVEFRNTAPWAQLVWESEQWSVSGGLRYNDSRYFGGVWGAQGGTVYRLGDASFYGNVARGFNLPGVYSSVFGRRQPPAWQIGESWKDLDPEIVEHAEVGWRMQWSSQISTDISFYHDDVSDALRFSPPPGGTLRNIGDYTIRGVEATVLWSPAETVELFAGMNWLDADPSDAPNAPEWMLSLAASWEPTEAWRFDLGYEFVDDRYVVNTRFNDTQEEVDAHQLVYARAAWRFQLSSARCELFLAADNLFDEDYAYRPGYPMPGTTWTLGFSAEL